MRSFELVAWEANEGSQITSHRVSVASGIRVIDGVVFEPFAIVAPATCVLDQYSAWAVTWLAPSRPLAVFYEVGGAYGSPRGCQPFWLQHHHATLPLQLKGRDNTVDETEVALSGAPCSRDHTVFDEDGHS